MAITGFSPFAGCPSLEGWDRGFKCQTSLEPDRGPSLEGIGSPLRGFPSLEPKKGPSLESGNTYIVNQSNDLQARVQNAFNQVGELLAAFNIPIAIPQVIIQDVSQKPKLSFCLPDKEVPKKEELPKK